MAPTSTPARPMKKAKKPLAPSKERHVGGFGNRDTDAEAKPEADEAADQHAEKGEDDAGQDRVIGRGVCVMACESG